MIINKVHSHLKVSQNNVVNRNMFLFSFLKDKLKMMFSDQQFVMKLSSMTRVYPEYYSRKMLRSFLQSADHNTHHKYLQQRNRQREKAIKSNNVKNSRFFDQFAQEQNNKHLPSDQLFQAFPSYKKLLPVLDCYVDWLMKHKLTPNSQEYYKNKCIMEMLDMRNPQNWFLNRQQRHFIYHHGPTNSGKTSSAIKELKQLPKDKKGIYMAPLRLLAWEMQQKLQNCNLITGQDKQFRVSNLTSCTIEALNINQQYDVAIIDEIQMIGDYERGWSWTKAILTTKAKRIHLCGDQRAIGLVSKLIRECGGTLEQRKYSRLGKLKLIPKIFQMNAIQEGDCMIEFSVQTLHKLRRKIRQQISKREKDQQVFGEIQDKSSISMTGNKDIKISTEQITSQEPTNVASKLPCPVAMVYGRLPPQCRKQEARKFNQKISPYLVATNAIGMGLNLNIKKIIFAGIKRRNSKGQQVELEEHEIQQIAGRAGRGLNDGLVQCVSYDILKKVRKALRNVNKTYGINLQDQQLQQQSGLNNKNLKNNTQDDEQKTESLLLINNIKNKNGLISLKPPSIHVNNRMSTSNGSSTIALQNYNHFLNRVLTQKQTSIQKAGLFIEYIFLKRMKNFIEQYYNQSLPLHELIKLYLNLALQSSDMYRITQKTQLVEWLEKLSKQSKYQSRDHFQIAKCLSMHYNSFYVKQKMQYFAKMFKRKKSVPLPLEAIQRRNQKICSNNYKKLDILQSNYSIAEVYINLWNKYEFIFNQLQSAKQIKQEIAELIKEVLQDEQGFNFKNKNKGINEQQEEKQQNSELDQKQDIRQTILDEETSDIQQIKIGN